MNRPGTGYGERACVGKCWPRLVDLGRLVQSSEVKKPRVGLFPRHPPAKHHPTRIRHREQVAIPRGLCGARHQRAVGEVILAKRVEIT